MNTKSDVSLDNVQAGLAHPYSLDAEVIFGQKLQNILASAQEDLTKDKIGAKVGEMTSFARQDCLFCGRGWDSHG